jgi:hypothetical protein
MYKAKSNLHWSEITTLSDPLEKKMLLSLIENPRCFFVLFNTQRGKLRIAGKEIASWNALPNKRVVSFLVVDNDRTLSEQSVNGLFSCFPVRPGKEHSEDNNEKYNVRIFELSSNNKTSLNDIITYIDAFAFNPSYAMPLIVVLANPKQIEKLVKILNHVITHPCKHLCAGGSWDEADKTYPPYREKLFSVGETSKSFLDLFNDPSERIIRCGFVTATEGCLLDEEYEECVSAVLYEPEIDPTDEENYFAFHKPECKKQIIEVSAKETNNLIADRVLVSNWPHLNTPYTLKNGALYHHKIIVNADVKACDMRNLALKHSENANVLTFNMRGVTLYKGGDTKRYSTKHKNLNQLFYYIYKKNALNDKPLIVIGRRKVDRGLGFHYAPRSHGHKVTKIDGVDGTLHTDGIEGLVWTDMIMGNKIEHIPTAVQKAGRGAGIIRQCPEYPGEFTYWVDAETATAIEHHYKKVDKVNSLPGTYSVLDAVLKAKTLLPMKKRVHEVDPETYRVIKGNSPTHTLELTKKILTNILGCTFSKPRRTDISDKHEREHGGTFYQTSLNSGSEIASLIKAVKKVPTAWGTNKGGKTYRRFYPCYEKDTDHTTLHCVIPLIDEEYTSVMKSAIKARIDSEFGDYLVDVPQEIDE